MTSYNPLLYVLITPARNEEAYIEKTIRSVISQTIKPEKWVVVSDASTDRTDELVRQYMPGNPWIELIRMPEHTDRNFARKVVCFNAGVERVKDIKYDIIVNLDGDVSFEEDFFEYLLDKFDKIPELGVAGTPYIEGESHSFNDSYVDIHHVHGQIQMFRRRCFESIGGYTPIKGGGIDWVAVTTARMRGWKTYSFQDKTFHHHRTMGTGGNGVLKARFNYGRKNFFLGGHPVWQIFRALYNMSKKPYIIGGLLLLSGYAWGFLSRMERPVSPELMKFHRNEQTRRLKSILLRTFKLSSEN